ncbi:MAG: hypothetical protein ACJAS9_002959, partial [Polaribacter sp.]
SRARNTAHPKSNYDLAVAFDKPLQDVLDNRLRPEVCWPLSGKKC